ncbi:hypothetical protein FHG87_024278, partial [Trinorchestia longiramus]
MLYTAQDSLDSGCVMLYTAQDSLDSCCVMLYTAQDSLDSCCAMLYTAQDSLDSCCAVLHMTVSQLSLPRLSRCQNLVAVSELDTVGCGAGCAALAAGRNEHHIFVMARDDALYSYSSEGRAGCYVFPGVKERLVCHRGYAVVTQAHPDTTSAATSASRRSVCNVYDLSNQVIAATCPLPGPLVGFLSEWAGLYAVCCSQVGSSSPPPSLLHFKENDLHSKMEILFKKNQYDIAVSLARGQNVSGEGVSEILKQYGDWLYSKGELALAVKQYIKTIPYLEPSYVIKK